MHCPQAVEKALGTQLRSTMPKALADGLKDSFATSVIPSFERATQAMFGQIEGAFSSGLNQHLKAATAEVSASLRESAAQVCHASLR